MEYRRYIKMLQSHLALLDVGGPALPTRSLSASISLQHLSVSEFPQWLTPHELQISLDTCFPAP
ncbi:hypothetical protein [Specibacter sp. NPDC078692]|uniref:hypothetical protein n=1 Tax=Specibacter sp. NPDC078692 TaxID=3155818 RepID=UPI00344346B8